MRTRMDAVVWGKRRFYSKSESGPGIQTGVTAG